MHNAAMSPAIALFAAALAAAQTAEQYLERAAREPSPKERIALATLALQSTTDPREKAGAYVTRADAYAELCRNEDALIDADAAVAALPSDESGYLTRAQVRSGAGDCKGALADMRKVFEIMPTPDVPNLVVRSNVRHACKSPLRDALADLDAASALSLKEGDRSAYARQRLSAARRLCAAKRYDAGLAEAVKAGADAASAAEAHVVAGRCLLDAGRGNEALTRLDSGIRQGEAAPAPRQQVDIKDTPESAIIIKRSFSLASAYSDRAGLHQAAGRRDQAIADLGKAIELTPEPTPGCRAQRRKRAALYRRRAELWAKKGEKLFAQEDLAAACSAGDKKSCAKPKPAKKR